MQPVVDSEEWIVDRGPWGGQKSEAVSCQVAAATARLSGRRGDCPCALLARDAGAPAPSTGRGLRGLEAHVFQQAGDVRGDQQAVQAVGDDAEQAVAVALGQAELGFHRQGRGGGVCAAGDLGQQMADAEAFEGASQDIQRAACVGVPDEVVQALVGFVFGAAVVGRAGGG
jgi:hypothetical protein